MIYLGETRTSARNLAIALIGFLAVLSAAAVFFVGDVLMDMRQGLGVAHVTLEALVTLALVLGIVFGGYSLRQTIRLMQAHEAALSTARGALSDVIAAQFARWQLTPAERDVGFLALKGFDVAEIAELRGGAQGTVRAQLARIYAKAGVSGRAQFAGFFVEDLLADGLVRPDLP